MVLFFLKFYSKNCLFNVLWVFAQDEKKANIKARELFIVFHFGNFFIFVW